MRFQRKFWTCGPAAVVNAARALGLRIAESRIASIAGTNEKDGTDDGPLIEGIRGVGLTAKSLNTEDRGAAWAFVRSSVNDGHPVILCVDDYQHWITVIGVIGDRVIIADSTNTEKNRKENGIHSLSRSDLLKRWKNKKLLEFFAIAVGRK